MSQEDFLLNFILRAHDEATSVVQSLGGNIEHFSGAAKIAMAAVGVAAVGVGVEAVRMAESFDMSMRKVYAMAGLSADQFESLKGQVLGLSEVVPKTADDLAGGLYYVVSAGFSGRDAMDVLTAAAKGATAGMTDTKIVADAVTSALNAYGLTGQDAARVTDELSAGVISGKTEFSSLAGSIGRVLPIASQLGVGLDEVVANMSTMTRVGLNADEAATALRGVLNALVKPGKDAESTLRDIGLSAAQLREELKTKGLMEVLQELMDKTGGNVGELSRIIPNVRALTDVLGTSGSQAKEYAGILDSVRNSTGRTDDAFKKMMDGLGPQLQLLKNNIAGVLIPIGEQALPILVDATKHVSDFVKGLQGAGSELKNVFGAVNEVVDVLTGRRPGAGGDLTALVGGDTAKGIMRFVADVREAFKGVAAAITPAKDAVVDFVLSAKAYIEPFVTAAIAALSRFWTEIQPKWDAAWSAISIALQYFWNHVLVPVVDAISTFLSEHWHDMIRVLDDAWNTITDVIRAAWDVISGIFKFALDLLSGNWSAAWSDIVDTVNNVMADVARFVRDGLFNLVPTVLRLAQGLGTAVVNGILEGLGNLKDAFVRAVMGAATSAIDAVKNFLGIHSPSQVMYTPGASIIAGLADAEPPSVGGAFLFGGGA